MKFEKEMTCIVCPNGCKLEVIQNDSIIVKNALCPKGEEYARNEMLNPVRNLTSTIRVLNGRLPLVSVRSSKPVPKGKLTEMIKILSEIDVEAPVEFHQIVVKDILGTGVDIIATREVLRDYIK